VVPTAPIIAAAPSVARAIVPWESLPPLRSLMPVLSAGVQTPVTSPTPVPVAPPVLGTSQALPPLLPFAERARTTWQQFQLRRPAPVIAVPAKSFPLLLPLRSAAADKAPAPSSPAPTPPSAPLPTPPSAPAPSSATGRRVPWESLPALRDATIRPERRVPWRRLPPLRSQ
jgi:hypothetical protein